MTSTNRLRGIALLPDRLRRLVPAACLLLSVVFGFGIVYCLLLSVVFGCGIVYVNFFGGGDGGGVCIVVEGNEVGDPIVNGEAGEGFGRYIDNDLNDGKEGGAIEGG
jgi:hypothetical protein